MDSLFMGSGLHGLGSSITASSGLDARPCPSQFSSVGRSPTNAISVDKGSDIASPFNLFAFKSLFVFSGGSSKQMQSPKGVTLDGAVSVEREDGRANCNSVEPLEQDEILRVKQGKHGGEETDNANCSSSAFFSSCDDIDIDIDIGIDSGGCRVCDDDDGKGKVEFDRNSFSKLLKKVSLTEARLYAQMSYLGCLAYDIPKIKPGNLLKRHGLRLVTSSVEKKKQLEREQLANAEAKEEQETGASKSNINSELERAECVNEKNEAKASTALQVVASAASYLHAQTRADAAAKEKVKHAVADDLNSINASPCEWFVCDDDNSATRFFVIQGSEKLESWLTNLLFEPILFEGLDMFVHRGIYEAAKGMYQQMLPEVRAHMKTQGRHAKFQFTGHSLGGSLSLLINLMLLMRGEVSYESLLPVITFGSPCVMCGGDDLLRKLGLPKTHIQAVVMHRDIVPRAFSCHYPKPAAGILKAVNANFRNHLCLNDQEQLYTHMGEMLILQPDANVSPQHDLLPCGRGLYLLSCNGGDEKQAKKRFLNIPHPLEILSDRAAYGNGGTIQRDHDMNSYLRCLRSVIHQELDRIRKSQREKLKKVLRPLLTPRLLVGVGPILGHGHAQFNFSGMLLTTGRHSLKRFSSLVASQHMHLILFLLFPALPLIPP